MKRVISLLPSCTEIICALKCADQLVGCSQGCDLPEVQSLPVCAPAQGSEIDTGKIANLHADLVFSPIPLPGLAAEVILLDSKRLSDLWPTIQLIADTLSVSETGRELISAYKDRLVDVISKTCMVSNKPTVCCLEATKPLKASGLWVPDLVELAGGHNLFSQGGKPAFELDWLVLEKTNPQVILLMPGNLTLEQARGELAPLEQRPEWHKINAVKHKKLFIVDSSRYFNRAGLGLIDSEEILAEILHPNLFHLGGEGKKWQRV